MDECSLIDGPSPPHLVDQNASCLPLAQIQLKAFDISEDGLGFQELVGGAVDF